MSDAGWRRIWDRARDAARALLRLPRSGQSAAEVSARAPAPPRLILHAEPVPADTAEHARQFAAVWADRFEAYAHRRMREVGVSEPYVGTVDVEHRIDRRAFFPDQSVGGRNIHRRGINLDSGILNPDLIDDRTDPALSLLWRKARLRDRADAVIAHEFEEASGAMALQHEEATQKAADTELLISDAARLLLRVAARRNR